MKQNSLVQTDLSLIYSLTFVILLHFGIKEPHSIVCFPSCADWVVKGKPVVLIEVQSEAEETQTLIRAGHQQHQELLDDALKEGQRKKSTRVNTRNSWLHLRMCQMQMIDSHSWRWLRLVPGRSGWGCGAGSASLVWCPGTPESSSSPLLPVRPSLPTDPESTDRIVSLIEILLLSYALFLYI